jgi:hypothetical protein
VTQEPETNGQSENCSGKSDNIDECRRWLVKTEEERRPRKVEHKLAVVESEGELCVIPDGRRGRVVDCLDEQVRDVAHPAVKRGPDDGKQRTLLGFALFI